MIGFETSIEEFIVPYPSNIQCLTNAQKKVLLAQSDRLSDVSGPADHPPHEIPIFATVLCALDRYFTIPIYMSISNNLSWTILYFLSPEMRYIRESLQRPSQY
jgi:hypothetical protein